MYVYDGTRGFIGLLTAANSEILSTPLYDFYYLFFIFLQSTVLWPG
jgi:hypothetical protein